MKLDLDAKIVKNEFVRKITYVFSILCLSVFLIAAYVNNAQALDLPKGLEDRGPIEKQTFIHYKRNNAKPDGVGGGKNSNNLTCYATFGKGIKWKSNNTNPIEYIINPSNSGISYLDLANATSLSVNEWDKYSSFILSGQISQDNSANWDDISPDYLNEISFGTYGDSNTIAVTNTWGYFSGPVQTREIIEFDILFNTNYLWGTNGANNLMDFQNILTHELGHGFGLKDIYTSGCEPVTMFGYSNYGDLEKRSLETDDIKGIQSIYGI